MKDNNSQFLAPMNELKEVIGTGPHSVLRQSHVPNFSVLTPDTGDIMVYTGADKTKEQISTASGKVFNTLSEATRYLVVKDGICVTGPMQYDDISISLPDCSYHNLEVFLGIEQVLQHKLPSKVENLLRVVVGDRYTYLSKSEVKHKLLVLGCTQREAFIGAEWYKYTFMFDHLLLHDFAHQFEPENIAMNDFKIAPYHVYQYQRMKDLLSGAFGSRDTDKINLADTRRQLRIALQDSLKNELFVSHIQSQFTTIDSMIENYKTIVDIDNQANFLALKKDKKNALFGIDCTKSVNRMITYVNSKERSKSLVASEKIAAVCTRATALLSSFIGDVCAKKTKDVLQQKELEKKYGNVISGVWKMISDEFGIPYRPYIPKKEEHVYYYHSDRVSDFLTAMVKKDAAYEYEYLYSRNHDTHLLLVAPDETDGIKTLIKLQMFFMGLYAKEIVKN